MTTYLDCWVKVATDLFAQALAGEPTLEEALPKPSTQGTFGYVATLSGDEQGHFSVVIDISVLDAPLLGEGMDQKAGWGEVMRETFEAASGELLAKSGKKCKVESCEETASVSQVSRSFQLRAGDRSWQILVRDEVKAPKPAPAPKPEAAAPPPPPPHAAPPAPAHTSVILSQGLELLLDVELEASLRFGCRELPLGDLLELGPGDVVQLDRHVTDPVDLVIGDKIVARGDVVLVNGNFGLRVTEVAEPRKRLESIRCLF